MITDKMHGAVKGHGNKSYVSGKNKESLSYTNLKESGDGTVSLETGVRMLLGQQR